MAALLREFGVLGKQFPMFALPSKADICSAQADVCFVPIAETEIGHSLV
jgi:hypothetical protein